LGQKISVKTSTHREKRRKFIGKGEQRGGEEEGKEDEEHKPK
jgi:hypothetical protein